MSHKPCVPALRRLIGRVAAGLAIGVGGVPAAFAQDSPVLEQGKPAAAGIEDERQTHQRYGSNRSISLAVPIGKVSVGPDLLDGEPIYVRRVRGGEGVTVVEVSTTPFMPVLSANGVVASAVARPDQPASW